MLSQGHGKKFLKPFFRHVVKDKGPRVLENLWRRSGLNFSDLIDEAEVKSFVDENVSLSENKNCITYKMFQCNCLYDDILYNNDESSDLN